ncbi:MAG: hypothetical protein V4726_11245 [Verrucomicrobiota bacterium]
MSHDFCSAPYGNLSHFLQIQRLSPLSPCLVLYRALHSDPESLKGKPVFGRELGLPVASKPLIEEKLR